MRILKVLGVIAGLYSIANLGAGIGVMVTSDYYEGKLDENEPLDSFLMGGIENWQKINAKIEGN